MTQVWTLVRLAAPGGRFSVSRVDSSVDSSDSGVDSGVSGYTRCEFQCLLGELRCGLKSSNMDSGADSSAFGCTR